MFALNCNAPPAGAYDLNSSTFDRNYPKESFSFDDPDNNPIDSVLHYCCGIIYESGLYRFGINCFGYEQDLPINCEMSILLEQIEHLMDFLRSDSPAITVIDFFEQGYEMTLRFSKTNGEIDVRLNIVRGDRIIQGQLSSEALNTVICRFLLDFLHAVGTLIPGMLTEPAFLQWFTHLCIAGREL